MRDNFKRQEFINRQVSLVDGEIDGYGYRVTVTRMRTSAGTNAILLKIEFADNDGQVRQKVLEFTDADMGQNYECIARSAAEALDEICMEPCKLPDVPGADK